MLGRARPRLWCLHIRLPKRPSATLARASVIEGTAARLWIEKDAVAIRVFDQTNAIPNASRKLALKAFKVIPHPDRVGQGFDFVRVNPNVPRRRPAATIAALRALK